MFRLTVLLTVFITFGRTNALPLSYYGPEYHLGHPVPFGPGLYPRLNSRIYNGYASNLDGYQGANNIYNDYAANGVEREHLRDRDHVVHKGAEDAADEELISRSDAGVQDYRQDAAGADYNHGDLGYYGRVNNYDAAKREGFGGAGSLGHKKGHKTSGFHKSYSNEESGKDSTFLDEQHDEAEEKFGKRYDNQYNDRKWGAQSAGLNNGQYGHSALYDTAARGDVKSVGVGHVNYDRLGHNGHYKDKDLIYNNGHLQAVRNDNHLSGLAGRHNNAHVNGYIY